MQNFSGIEISEDNNSNLYVSRQEQRHRQTVRTAAGLTLGGAAMVCLGATMYWEGFARTDWLGAFVLGLLCLIPGVYASIIAYGATHKWAGYSWSAID